MASIKTVQSRQRQATILPESLLLGFWNAEDGVSPMEPSLTRGEYWLLETVVECATPLCFLDPASYDKPEGIVAMFNKPGHGLDRTRLIETLDGLLKEGLVEAVRHGKPTALTGEQIASALAEPRPVLDPTYAQTYYRLTQKGGAVWEGFAAPSWECYIREELDDETRTGVLTCMTLWRVETYLRYLILAGCEVDLESVDMERLGRWEATYWKVLPRGHRAEFRWLRDTERGPRDDLSWLVFGGFCEYRDSWYRWR